MHHKPINHGDQRDRLKNLANAHLKQIAKVAEANHAREEAVEAWQNDKDRLAELAQELATYVSKYREHVLVALDDGIICLIQNRPEDEPAQIHFIKSI